MIKSGRSVRHRPGCPSQANAPNLLSLHSRRGWPGGDKHLEDDGCPGPIRNVLNNPGSLCEISPLVGAFPPSHVADSARNTVISR
jgi:hypothetical protein